MSSLFDLLNVSAVSSESDKPFLDKLIGFITSIFDLLKLIFETFSKLPD